MNETELGLTTDLRLGVIEVLNALPVYYPLLEHRVQAPVTLVKGKVTELNEKLNQGLLDISVVSSFEYAQHPEAYRILPGLSISARGAVKSIYLFSQVPLAALAGQTVGLTAFSLTSVHLVQYLLEYLQCRFVQGEPPEAKASLLIADEAIARFYQQRDPYVYDLGELWWQKTGLPFAFALWVAREEVCQASPDLVTQTWQALLAGRDQAAQNCDEIARQRFAGLFPDVAACRGYLQNLLHDFTPETQSGFQRFMAEMTRLGKLPQVAELRFFHP